MSAMAVPPTADAVIEIAMASESDALAWNAYVEQHAEGTFFHLFGWREVLARAIGFEPHFLIARAGGQIVGVLPLAAVKSRLFGNALVSLPFCVEGGVLADSVDVVTRLLDAATHRAQIARVDYLELRHKRRMTTDWPCKDSTYVTFTRAILPVVDDNLKEIPRKQRAVVRKGIAAGLVSREEHEIENLFTIYATSVRNLGTPVFPKRYFAALLQVFRERARITTVYHQQTPVAAVLSFLYKGTVMPYYGGGLPVARDLKAYDFMYWEVMRTACEAGFTTFDYGRSKCGSGSYSFKKNWGFEPTPLEYEYYLVNATQMPDRNPNNPKFELAVKLWKRLPLAIANRIGPLVSPYLA